MLGDLMLAVETVDVTLDQMQHDSELLKTLAGSPDPGVSYALVAGNISIVSAALEPPAGEQPNLLERLLKRLGPTNLLHKATAPAFFGEPNDIAVSVASMSSITPDRAGKMEVHQVGCDHLSYFTDGAGSQLLAEILSRDFATARANRY